MGRIPQMKQSRPSTPAMPAGRMAPLPSDRAATEPATASVIAARDTGTRINGAPLLEVEVVVFAEGRPPCPTTVRGPVGLAQLGLVASGSGIPVRVSPSDPMVAVFGC